MGYQQLESVVAFPQRRDSGNMLGSISRPRPFLSRWHMTAGLQIADLIAVSLFIIIAVGASSFGSGDTRLRGDHLMPEALLAGTTLIVILHMVGAYRYALLSKAGLSSVTVILACMAILGPFMLLHAGADSLFLAWTTAAVCVLVAIRLVAASIERSLSRAGYLAHTICVIGQGSEALSCTKQLQSGTSNNAVLGYFLADGQEPAAMAGVPYLGRVDHLATYLRGQRLDEIIVATPVGDGEGLSELIADLSCLPVVLSLWPGTINLAVEGMSVIPLLPLRQAPLSGWAWVFKDVQDRAIGAMLLLVSLPLLLLVAIVIKICSPGPVFYRQIREGYNGREFRIFKFRSMHVANIELMDKLVLTVKNDKRIFPFGGFLRRSSLDELPQLLNVLIGDMWLVGPRPHSPLATAGNQLYADAILRYRARHQLKPGITGWAQIRGWRGPTNTVEQLEQRVVHDLYYIDHWSPLFDFRILVLTVLRGFVHRNAF